MFSQGFQYVRRDVIMFTEWYSHCPAVSGFASYSGCPNIESGPGNLICSFTLAVSWVSMCIVKKMLRGTLCNYLFLVRLSHTIIYIGLLRVALTILTFMKGVISECQLPQIKFLQCSFTPNKVLWIGYGNIWHASIFRAFLGSIRKKSSDSMLYLFCF
jgi:hypothetical protein